MARSVIGVGVRRSSDTLGFDGFLFEGDVEAGLDGLDDTVAKAGDVGVGSVATVDEGEGVAGGDASFAVLKRFVESGLFEEPGGG